MPHPDHQQAMDRTETQSHRVASHDRADLWFGRELDIAGLQPKATRHGSWRLDHVHDPGDAAACVQGFCHHLQPAGTGQAEAVSLVGTDAVGHQTGQALGQDPFDAFVLHRGDEIVLDAATGYRSHHHPIVAQRHQRTGRARRRPPCLGHGDQRHVMVFLLPLVAAP